MEYIPQTSIIDLFIFPTITLALLALVGIIVWLEYSYRAPSDNGRLKAVWRKFMKGEV